MAVLEAVRGWEELAKLTHINDVGKDDSTAQQEEDSENKEEVDSTIWTPAQLEYELEGLLETDYVNLLLEHEEYIQSPTASSIRMLPISHTPVINAHKL